MQYSLTPENFVRCEDWAKQRQDPKAALGVQSLKYSDRTDLEIHRLGVWAECAYSHLFEVPMHQLDGVGGDGGDVDYSLLGLSVSIKATFPHAGYLVIPLHQYSRVSAVDILIMARLIEPRTIEFVGWTTGQVFREHRVQRDFTRDNTAAKGLSYCMPQEWLTPMETLLAWKDEAATLAVADRTALLNQVVEVPVLIE